MTRVLIKPFRKHKIDRHCIWVIIDYVTRKAIRAEKSMSEAIFQVEQEGWILEPNA